MTDLPENDTPETLTPERVAEVWAKLEAAASRIADAETREAYLAAWRAKYEVQFPRWLHDASIVQLPEWKHLGEIAPVERRRAKRVCRAWIDEQGPAGAMATAPRLAWELARRVAAGFIEEDEARRLADDWLGDMADAEPVRAAWRRGAHDAAGESLLAAIVLDLRCCVLDRTEDGLAQRFVLRAGHDFRHTTAKGWMKWDGRRWKVLEEERGAMPAELLDAARATVAAIAREARAMRATLLASRSVPEGSDPEDFKVEVDGVKVALAELEDHPEGLDGLVITASTCRLSSEALGRFGKSSAERKRYLAMVDIARSKLTVRYQDFDTDPLTINCQNGTLRLLKRVEDGEVHVEARLDPHCRADLLTKVAAVPYDPEARCPLYDGTIEWAQPKPEMRRYLHQWGGYNLTGEMGAQIFHIWWGPLAQNGKSTILDAWADCAGDYADAGKVETFMEASQARGGDAATPALARLPGVRMLRTGEPPANAKFEESLINQITGQDTLQIRDNFRSFYAAKMQFKLTVACNQPPAIPNATEGIRRRIKVVPFEKTMKGALKPDGTPMRDENFKEKLVPEMPGIFARLVQGALDWLKHGFVEPGDVTAWTEEYKDENDPLGRFLSYCTVIDPESRIQAKPFHDLFDAWARATGGPDWSIQFLKKKMVGKGFSSKASNGMQWLGLRATKEVRDFLDEHGNVKDLSALVDHPAHAGGAASARAVAASGGPSAPPSRPDLPPDPFDDDDPWRPS